MTLDELTKNVVESCAERCFFSDMIKQLDKTAAFGYHDIGHISARTVLRPERNGQVRNVRHRAFCG